MNYYVKGDAANAGKIKAAFEKLGIDVLDFGFADKTLVYCSIGGCVQSLPYSINLMHILYSHPDYQELELTVKPKFKVGDRVIYNGNVCTITFMDEVYYDFDGGVAGCRIEKQDELLRPAPKFKVGDWIISVHPDAIFKVGDVKKTTYKLIDIYGDGYDCQITEIDKNYHLWSIADAKYGDVLANTAGCILIAKDNESCLCYIDKNGGFHADNNKWFFVDFSDNALTPATKEQRDLLFAKMREAGYTWDEKKKELRKTIEPTFKVGDWVVTDYGKVSQVVSVDNAGDGYTLDDGVYFSGSWCDMYRLWTIADAKDGDVLVSGIDNPFIYDGNIEFSSAGAYVGVSRNGRIRLDMFPSKAWTSIKDVKPATIEQRHLLFSKIREVGYQWDAEKKELRKRTIEPVFKVGDEIFRPARNGYFKIKDIEKDNGTVWYVTTHIADNDKRIGGIVRINALYQNEYSIAPKTHYGIANFQPFDKVLVRDANNDIWEASMYGNYSTDDNWFICVGNDWRQCIPFNDETKHLLGTTDMCPEEYINW